MGDIHYNAVNRAGANNSREVRGPLLVEVLAANRRDSGSQRVCAILIRCFSGPSGSKALNYPDC